MIFSRWRPDTGGYDYLNSPSTRFGLGDDLPVPVLPTIPALGMKIACSTDVGRAIPADAAPSGSGPIARGMLAPMGKVGTGLGSFDLSATSTKVGVAILCAVGLGYLVGRKKKR